MDEVVVTCKAENGVNSAALTGNCVNSDGGCIRVEAMKRGALRNKVSGVRNNDRPCLRKHVRAHEARLDAGELKFRTDGRFHVL